MPSQPIYMKPLPVWGQHIHYTCDITATIYVITPSVQTTSHPLSLWHHTRRMCGIVCLIQDITSSLFDLKPPFWGHHTHYTRHCVHCICVITPTLPITATICMISHPVYVRHSVHYIYDIVPTVYDNTTLCVDYTTLGICMTSFALQKMSHPLYHTKPQSLWLHIHFRHDITSPVSDIAPTVSLSSQPLRWYHTHFCMTSNPLYLWHYMHYI